MNFNDIQINPKDSNAINYVKSRIAIEADLKGRANKRGAKMVVINHLGGVIKHPTPEEQKRGMQKLVVFPDKTHARF